MSHNLLLVFGRVVYGLSRDKHFDIGRTARVAAAALSVSEYELVPGKDAVTISVVMLVIREGMAASVVAKMVLKDSTISILVNVLGSVQPEGR